MTPEEKFIRGIWEALKRLKENALYTKRGKPVPVASSLIDGRALDILEEWQVIKIRENPWEPPASTKNVFYLDINRAKVNELDSLCKNGLEENVAPEKLLKMIKEWVHPIGKDEKLGLEIWELIRGKKKVARINAKTRAEEIERQLAEMNERQKEREVLKKEVIDEIQNKKPNIYDLGYNKNLILKEVVKEERGRFQQRIKEERDERERRERLRIQRIAASGKPPILYTIDKIIEECLTNKDEERIEIDFYSLGFEDNIYELNNASRFFNKLKNAGCFDSVERSANTWFIVTKPNIEKLKIFKKGLTKELYESSGKIDEGHFNHKNCSLIFNSETYKSRGGVRKALIKNLWMKHQKQNNKGKIIQKGERLPESFFAVEIGMIREVEEFKSQRIKNKFKRIKKELNRIFSNKKFPIRIDSTAEGILLIWTV